MSATQRIKFLWILFLIGVGLVAVFAAVGNATTLVRMSFQELAAQSTAIARVHCVQSNVHWRGGNIWTRTDFTVTAQSKGALPGSISIEMPGGALGHLRSHVDEIPAFAPGEDAYLFLWTAPDDTFRILGWSQGAFRIQRDVSSGLETVTQDSAAAPLFDPVSRQFRHSGVRNLPIAVFELKLKRALAEKP